MGCVSWATAAQGAVWGGTEAVPGLGEAAPWPTRDGGLTAAKGSTALMPGLCSVGPIRPDSVIGCWTGKDQTVWFRGSRQAGTAIL